MKFDSDVRLRLRAWTPNPQGIEHGSHCPHADTSHWVGSSTVAFSRTVNCFRTFTWPKPPVPSAVIRKQATHSNNTAARVDAILSPPQTVGGGGGGAVAVGTSCVVWQWAYGTCVYYCMCVLVLKGGVSVVYY